MKVTIEFDGTAEQIEQVLAIFKPKSTEELTYPEVAIPTAKVTKIKTKTLPKETKEFFSKDEIAGIEPPPPPPTLPHNIPAPPIQIAKIDDPVPNTKSDFVQMMLHITKLVTDKKITIAELEGIAKELGVVEKDQGVLAKFQEMTHLIPAFLDKVKTYAIDL